MDGFPLEIILIFGGLGLLMLGAALEDLKNYIIKKALKGRKRKNMQIFKKLLRSDEEKLGKAVMKHIDGLRKEIRVLKDHNAYLQDDNSQLVRTLNALQKKYDDLQGKYNLLEEENKHIHSALANALVANGQLKRKYEGIGPGTVEADKSIFTTKTRVKAGEKNA